ncbi:Lrp/AsnC family transcriptional regulator [Phenylobacterium sp.]|jgi:DNA-binding Lrp family transcriptional regulator|uniref:Lrp/AsnC family transcriptional regulator n=1 Tax=Phenylobacterium sp. TaxID=1871053 RepID=UPI0037CA95A1
MDDLDEHLIERLRANARAPISELARALGLSRTTIQSRLARLERTGVITGYDVRLKSSDFDALALIDLAGPRAAEATAALARLSAVRRLRAVSGPCDLIADIAAATPADLEAALAAIREVGGVAAARLAVILAEKGGG